MKKPILLIVGIVIIVSIIIGFLRGDEDTWICDQGAWIAHGHPSSAQPTSGCGEGQTGVIPPTEHTLPTLPN